MYIYLCGNNILERLCAEGLADHYFTSHHENPAILLLLQSLFQSLWSHRSQTHCRGIEEQPDSSAPWVSSSIIPSTFSHTGQLWGTYLLANINFTFFVLLNLKFMFVHFRLFHFGLVHLPLSPSIVWSFENLPVQLYYIGTYLLLCETIGGPVPLDIGLLA